MYIDYSFAKVITILGLSKMKAEKMNRGDRSEVNPKKWTGTQPTVPTEQQNTRQLSRDIHGGYPLSLSLSRYSKPPAAQKKIIRT